ncbi:hypothetical protein O6H91_21G060000 [Diphasiastrum complanatum]|uniref:Uncharacterized protein n=1 Tax=Diphasiastrum complanatum TaxID=34168 RepID=A0ACC2AMQ1_DIPCM|nr:hypothetical protein O6H91_21G060000 [Diphasiastrum complanatum]
MPFRYLITRLHALQCSIPGFSQNLLSCPTSVATSSRAHNITYIIDPIMLLYGHLSICPLSSLLNTDIFVLNLVPGSKGVPSAFDFDIPYLLIISLIYLSCDSHIPLESLFLLTCIPKQ